VSSLRHLVVGQTLDLGHVAWTATEPSSNLVEIGSLVPPPQHAPLERAQRLCSRRGTCSARQPGKVENPADVLGAPAEASGQFGLVDALVSQTKQATFERT
jgi:hypothetical protein